jgi:hypothetical protein
MNSSTDPKEDDDTSSVMMMHDPEAGDFLDLRGSRILPTTRDLFGLICIESDRFVYNRIDLYRIGPICR